MANPGKASGGAYERRGRIYLRVTVARGKRASVALPWCSSLPSALERAAVVQGLVDRLREGGHDELVPKVVAAAAEQSPTKLVAIGRAIEGLLAGQLVPTSPKPGTGPVTVASFAKEWTDGDLHARWPDHVARKDAAGVAADARVFRKYINPEIGTIALERLTLEDVDRVLANLPSHLAPASRRQVAQSLHRVLALACYPARHLRETPIPKGWLPKVKRSKAFTFVWPEELAALEACAEIPLVRRLFFGVLAREGMRRDELAELRWDDLDLQRGMVRLDVNKTDDPRAWALSPDVARALALWKERQGEAAKAEAARVFTLGGRPLYVLKFAEHLRADLATAGVTRAELFERSGVRRPVRVHDLRATFVTVSLANARSESWVADRTGHRTSDMINRYRRAARTWAEANLGSLAPLDTALAWDQTIPDPVVRRRHGGGHRGGTPSGEFSESMSNSAERKGFEPLVSLHPHMISNHAPSATRSSLPQTPSP